MVPAITNQRCSGDQPMKTRRKISDMYVTAALTLKANTTMLNGRKHQKKNYFGSARILW
jgi:hypothetical protein